MMNREDLSRLVPHVLRARGWRLYTDRGRLIDLWQYGGRALLGHNPPGLLRAFKNNAERGLYAPYPHFAEERFRKALSVLLPGRSFRIYESEASLRDSLSATEFMLWRPFLGTAAQPDLQSAPVLFPVLPCPFPGAPAVLALDPQKADDALKKLPPSQALSPVALAAAIRCVYDLIAIPERGNPRLPKVDKALKKTTVWERTGIYLFYSPAGEKPNTASTAGYKTNADSAGGPDLPENYAALFHRFLEGGFLLPPSPEDPAILPGELSPGEEAKLAELFISG